MTDTIWILSHCNVTPTIRGTMSPPIPSALPPQPPAPFHPETTPNSCHGAFAVLGVGSSLSKAPRRWWSVRDEDPGLAVEHVLDARADPALWEDSDGQGARETPPVLAL